MKNSTWAQDHYDYLDRKWRKSVFGPSRTTPPAIRVVLTEISRKTVKWTNRDDEEDSFEEDLIFAQWQSEGIELPSKGPDERFLIDDHYDNYRDELVQLVRLLQVIRNRHRENVRIILIDDLRKRDQKEGLVEALMEELTQKIRKIDEVLDDSSESDC